MSLFLSGGREVSLFIRVPWGTAREFVAKAIEHELLIIPGNVFSRYDSHFHLSFAAGDQPLERGIEVLKRLAHADRPEIAGVDRE